MVTPKWVLTKCQPIAIRDVIHYLTGVLLKEEHYNKSYDIGGPNVITYKEMMLVVFQNERYQTLDFYTSCNVAKAFFLLVVFCNFNIL